MAKNQTSGRKRTGGRKQTSRSTNISRRKASRRKSTRGRKKAAKGKKAGFRPRPKLTTGFVKKIADLRDDLQAIVAVGKDTQGTLTTEQLLKATRMHLALDQAEQEVFCVQTLVAY